MINKSIFREYDIRGIVPEELNEQSVKLLGFFFGLEVQKQSKRGLLVMMLELTVL